MIEKKTYKTFLNRLHLGESYYSLLVGLITVVVIGLVIVSFARIKGNSSTSVSSNSTLEQKEVNKDKEKTSEQEFYVVKKGDSLWSIAEKLYKSGYDWVKIAKANNLVNPGIVHAGNKLVIPSSDSQKDKESSIALSPDIITASNLEKDNGSIAIEGDKYTIVEGDNLWDIAIRAYGDGFKWPELAKANNLENPDLIFADNNLKIPR